MQLWIWRNFRIELPDTWEMLQFSRRPELGRCAFADRHEFRLEMHWRVGTGEPEFGRMMSDYEARLREDGVESTKLFELAGWHGVSGEADHRLTTRFGAWFPEESSLVELVFIWPKGRDHDLEARVLRSVRPEPVHGNAYRRWRAFGMDLLSSADLPLDECRAEPANVQMRFKGRRGLALESFARRGMVEQWLTAPIDAWVRSLVPLEVAVTAERRREVAGHRMVWLTGNRRVRGMGAFLGMTVPFHAAAWICPKDGRLYSMGLTESGTAVDASAPELARRLSCCDALSLFSGAANGFSDASEVAGFP